MGILNSYGDVRYCVGCLCSLSEIPRNHVADSRLTAIGEEQARNAHAAWEREIPRGVPIPQRFYCSPLTRAIHTLELTFEGILPAHLRPLIVEVTSYEPSCALTNPSPV